MKYKSHHFTTLLAKAQASNAGRERERRVLPHPIPLVWRLATLPPATAPPHPPPTHTGFPLSSVAGCWVSQRPSPIKKKMNEERY